MYCREQQRNDQCAHPGKKKELRAEASQQVGYATRLLNDLPHIGTIEEEKLKLLLIMQMMRIGQSEKEKNRHTEKEREEHFENEK